jgi:hypothetical protein
MYRFADEDEDEDEEPNEKIHEGLGPTLEELSKLHLEESWVVAIDNGNLIIVGSSPEQLFNAFCAAIEENLGG